jgi:hypothetical protein
MFGSRWSEEPIDERLAVRDLKLTVDPEKQRELRGTEWLDALSKTRATPCHAQRRIHLPAGWVCRSRHMMEETAECSFAEALIFPSVENELVPEIISHPGRHPNQPITHTQAHQKEIAQRLGNPQLAFLIEVRMALDQTRECGGGKDVRTDELLAPEPSSSP